MRKRQIKLKKGNTLKDHEVVNFDIAPGGVLELHVMDEHGKESVILVSPNAWDEAEFDV